MSSNYPGNPANYPVDIPIDDDGDAPAAARLVNRAALEGLADRTASHETFRALLDELVATAITTAGGNRELATALLLSGAPLHVMNQTAAGSLWNVRHYRRIVSAPADVSATFSFSNADIVDLTGVTTAPRVYTIDDLDAGPGAVLHIGPGSTHECEVRRSSDNGLVARLGLEWQAPVNSYSSLVLVWIPSRGGWTAFHRIPTPEII